VKIFEAVLGTQAQMMMEANSSLAESITPKSLLAWGCSFLITTINCDI